MTKSSPIPLVGAHMSAAGGAYKALYEGQRFSANVIQLFTSNQKRWEGKKIDKKEIELWETARAETKITHIMSHAGYLINLGSSNHQLLTKSKKALQEEIVRCHLLDLDYLTLHPGSAVGTTESKCLDTITSSLLELASLIKRGKTRILLETTAGQGSIVGYSFDHLAYIIKKLKKRIPLGVCIDTCHIFAAGYDIRTKKAWEKTLSEFDKIIGIKNLFAFHVNDSKEDLGSRKDRHAPLGTGKIGLECFKYLMSAAPLYHLPKYLETPDEKKWKKEIQMLKDFAQKR